MLLPSALSCNNGMAQPKPRKSSRPILPTFDTYDACRRSQSPVVGLIASCRALHSMLDERFAPSPSPSIEATLQARQLSSPFGQPSPPPKSQPVPRRVKKRRRDEHEDEHDTMPDYQGPLSERHNDSYSTPKRRRVVPLDLPAGLQVSDFEALAEPTYTPAKTPRRRRKSRDIEMPAAGEEQPQPPPVQGNSTWSENDDRLLVETVLSKLNLSSRDWNDCARRLGKDKDSIGRRWQLLVGEGNVGLRRGAGRMERIDLDTESW